MCEERFPSTHWRVEDSQHVIYMPFKDDPSYLGESWIIALRKLKSLWALMSKDEQYLSLYKEFLNEHQNLIHRR